MCQMGVETQRNTASWTRAAALQAPRPEEAGRLFTMFLAHPTLALCLLLGHAEPEPDLLSKLQAAPAPHPPCITWHACVHVCQGPGWLHKAVKA